MVTVDNDFAGRKKAIRKLEKEQKQAVTRRKRVGEPKAARQRG